MFARGDPPETLSVEDGGVCRIVLRRRAGSGSLLECCDSALRTSDCARTLVGFQALQGGSSRVVVASDELKDLVVLLLVVCRHLGPFRQRFRFGGIRILSRWLFVVRLVFHQKLLSAWDRFGGCDARVESTRIRGVAGKKSEPPTEVAEEGRGRKLSCNASQTRSLD